MSRLYLRIYLTLVASIFVFAILSVFAWRYLAEPPSPAETVAVIAEMAQGILPDAAASPEEQQRALESIAARARVDLGLFDAARNRIAGAGRPVPRPERERSESGRMMRGGPMGAWAIALPDGRWLVARVGRPPRNPVLGIVFALGVLALATAVAAYPIARRLTRRIERLQTGVEAFGGGDLRARVKVEGADEVARLAASFNRSAERIEELVRAHKTLLANASHELRSPLARIRMAIETLQDAGGADRAVRGDMRAELARDIAELDQLIDEILLASRLDAHPDLERHEPVDLLAVAAEEGARVGVEAEGEPITVRGDPRLLRRLVRNLLENAKRHGGDGDVSIVVRAFGPDERGVPLGDAVISVCDRGPGVPEDERERIFEPFHRVRGASESAGGVGLGLALVRSIARRHGGEVRCIAREGGGSCFEVRLAEAPPLAPRGA